MNHAAPIAVALAGLLLGTSTVFAEQAFVESDGLLVVEAENFAEQTKDEVRRWYRFDADDQPELKPDPDPPHLEGA
ncbi:MAG: hypothetical protein AAF656_11005, partial [Planctomycetota bacterium]